MANIKQIQPMGDSTVYDLSVRYMRSPDTHSVTINPNDLNANENGIQFDFKQKSITGLNASYSGIMSYRPYASGGDWSGGPAHQLAFDENGIHWRKSTGDTTWQAWQDIVRNTGTWGISITGNAATATALTSNAGSSTVPIYFSSGKPVQCSTTLGVSITGNAATATALTTNAGSSTVPIYFSGGKPVQCSTTLGVSITGNAATATKLGTSTIGDAITGFYLNGGTATNLNIDRYHYDGTEDWNNYPWHKVATAVMTGNYQDRNIKFIVSSGENANLGGILVARVRSNDSSNIGEAQLTWETITSGVDPAMFILTYSGTKAELWCKMKGRWAGWVFRAVNMYDRAAKTVNWTLNDSISGHGSSTYTSGTIITSACLSLRQSITGSAGSVAWGNVTGKPSTFAPSSHTHAYLPFTIVSSSSNFDNYKTDGIYFIRAGGNTNYATTEGNHGVLFVCWSIGTPFQVFLGDSSIYYFRKRYWNGSAWTAWTTMNAAWA